jgi:crotonobetainyl-CoA:carnitine CoA-transferase CaiB-like acyl-CoA transferase
MMDTLVSLMFMENLEETIADGEPLRTGNISRSGPTGLYETKDGDLSLTVTSDEQWGRLSRALDAPNLLENPLFRDYVARTVNVEAARQEIQRLIGKFTLDAALKRLEEFDVPCAPVRTAEQVMNDQHFWDRGSLVPMLHAAMDEPVEGVASGFPVKFSGGELPTPAGAPTLGMHNSEIFKKFLGLNEKDLKQLKEEKVI